MERARLAGALVPFTGASVQKAWLPAPLVALLQLRVRERNLLVLVDARAGAAVEAAERPEAPEAALPAQAILRRALTGARLASISLERQSGEHARRPPWLRLSFDTPRGSRALIAEPGARPLLLLLGDGDRIVWSSFDRAAGPAPEDRRLGAALPRGDAVLLPPPDEREKVSAGSLLARDDLAETAARKAALLQRLKVRTGKLARTLAAVEADLARARDAEGEQRRAELLLPHQGKIARGAKEARVPDWSQLDEGGQPAQVTIALDPALSAAENASRWLKKAHRLQAAVPRIDARRAEVLAAQAAVRALQESLRAAEDKAAVRALEEQALLLPGLGKPLAAPQRKPAGEPRLPFRVFVSSSGARILVGRGARDNDALTLRIARGNDLWLHAQGLKGAHVVIPEPGESPDQRTLLDAALLAAHFSSLRGAEAADVAWTRRKHVRKAKGAKPGSVTITQEKTIRVRPDPARLAALLASEGKP